MDFDKVISLIWLYLLALFSTFPSFCFLRGEDFEDVLKVFLLVVIIATLVSIGLSFLVMLVKGNFYELL